MERLTEKDFENDFCLECRDYGEPNGCNRSTGTCDAYDFCGEAEDTGFTPEQISALQAENERLRAEVEISKVAQMNLDIDIVSTYDALRDEIDRWKARAEALERAIKECKVKDECDLKCHMCVNEGCEGYYDRDGDDRWVDGECDWCKNRSKWQFAEARFAGGERE